MVRVQSVANDENSRRSTANTNFGANSDLQSGLEFYQGTPGTSHSISSKAEGIKRMGSGRVRPPGSASKMETPGSERSILKEASHEAITLSLDPRKKKKQLPRNLVPLDGPSRKIKGNYA
jgi:hypothetical protein